MSTKNLIFSVLLIFCLPFYSMAEDGDKNSNEIEIPLELNKNKPRTPDVMDCTISGFYSNGIVYLYFNDAAEDVFVEISNTDTGDLWAETLISPSYCEQIVIGNSLGLYSIAITTSSGDIYLGFFQL